MEEDRDEEMFSDEDEDEEFDSDDEDEDEDEELDNISESELEEMAASTQRSLFMVRMQMANQRAVDEADAMDVDDRSPLERWQGLMDAIPRSKVLRITDADCKEMNVEDLHRENLVLNELTSLIRSHGGITHVILGGVFLQILRHQQKNLFEAVWTNHRSTLTYLKLGSDESHPNVLDLKNLLLVLKWSPQLEEQQSYSCMDLHLTELELRKIVFRTVEDMSSLLEVLRHTKNLKQLNLLGVHLDAPIAAEAAIGGNGLFDSLLHTIAGISTLDECRLSCHNPSPVPLISPSSLEHMFSRKPKWWRLGLDGLGLGDDHCRVIAQAMSQETCKAGDLLSLTLNPAITSLGWNQVFDVLFQKQRMGLVKVDDESWQATFDLVRSMNNLHGRLEFMESGSFTSQKRWIEWLAKVSQISWEDEAHKLNYLWFTIMERPDYVHCRHSLFPR